MSIGRRELSNVYASLADPYGVALYASADALREIAKLLDNGSSVQIALGEAPSDIVQAGPVRALRILPAEGPIEIRADGEIIEIAGGVEARRMLAATLKNLALEPYDEGPVPRHVDLEYFPDHGFLSERAMWMSVFLLPEPGA
jgi:hypothetical protein